MMRKYFPLEASERLFVAIEEDDVVDAQVSLPPTIALSCTTEIIHDNYALCLKFWLDGVNRQELLRLIRKQAKGDELTTDERKQFKYMRARYKHLRFAQRLYLKKHQAGFLFGKTTVFLGHFQDGFRNGKKNIVSFYGNLLRVYLSSPVWWLVNYSLRHSQLETVNGFIAYRQKQMYILKAGSYKHLRAHETPEQLVCRLLLEKKNQTQQHHQRSVSASQRRSNRSACLHTVP